MTTPDLTDLFTHTADPAWLLANGVFVAEGRHVTRRLLETPRFTTIALLLTPTAEAAMCDVIDALPPDRRPPIVVKSQADLDALTRFRLHQGCVAFAVRQALPAWTAADPGRGLSVLLERVRDPDNVGSIVRSAAALGVHNILIGPECADPFYRKAIRTSMGSVLTSRLVAAEPWPEVLASLKGSGHTLVATTPDPSAPALDDVAAGLRSARVVLMMGSEGEGLTADARRAADIEARIPMVGGVDSLNVAVATAVAVYALSRRL